MAPAAAHRPLTGRAVVVTGAGRGFGRVLARRLGEAGADLLLVSRDAAALDALAAELEVAAKPGQHIEALALDLAAPGAADRVFAGRWQALDVLVNNAAVQGPIGRLWETPFEAWRQAIEIDLVAPAALCHAALPLLIARGGGAVVNLSGGGAAGPRPNFSAYAAAKSGLVRLTECLAIEAASHGIAVTAVAPGALPTAMAEEVLHAGAAAGAAETAAARRVLDAEEDPYGPAVALCLYLAERPRLALSGRLIAARWDDWEHLEDHADELAGSDIYTLRRIRPAERGKSWGEKS